MVRSILFSALILGALGVLVPLIPQERLADSSQGAAFDLTEPDTTLDVDGIRRLTHSRALRTASDDDLARLRALPLSALVADLTSPDEHTRAMAAGLLGGSGHADAVAPLIRAFELAQDRRDIEHLAMALAESRRTEALESLILAIRHRVPIRAYEACRALKTVYGHNLGLDADKWERWLQATRATRD